MLVKSSYTLSQKNISVPPRHIYREKLISKAIQFIRRLRFRVYYHENPHQKPEKRDFYGLKSESKPPEVTSLIAFETAFWAMIKNVKFRRDVIERRNPFQRDLKSKISDLTKDDNSVIIKGDKSSYLYQCPKNKYSDLVVSNLRKFYKKEDKNRPEIVQKINKNIDKFGEIYNVVDRIRYVKKQDVFLTLKDHKNDFERTEPCRLINPTKSDLGTISKSILDKVLMDLRSKFNPKLGQFKNTNDALEWFRSLEEFERKAFLTYDICDFYPSITEEILRKTLFWAKNHVKSGILSQNDIDLILAARISILAYKGDIWVKKTGEFDVTMGSSDGAEVAELVGLYLLYELGLKGIIPRGTFGLYRDDGIVALTTSSGRRQEYIRQDLRKFFNNRGFKIDITPARPFVEYLDVRMHTNKIHEIYYKPNNDTTYVNIQSNHPRSILKNFKNNTENRLSTLCSNNQTFERHAQRYKDILSKSGHPSDIKFKSQIQAEKPKTKKRKNRTVSWFNPPFNLDIKSNLGKQFFELIRVHFGKSGSLKFLNKHTVKLSYSTMGNVKSIYTSHNKKVLSNEPKVSETCVCRSQYAGKPRTCPIPTICNETNVVYKAKVTETARNKKSVYFGLTMNPLKTRVNQHLSSFAKRSNKTITTIAKCVHDMEDRGAEYEIDWSIERRTKHWNGGDACNLCLAEKSSILFSQDANVLNQRKELFSKCPHQKKYKIKKKKKKNGESGEENSEGEEYFYDAPANPIRPDIDDRVPNQGETATISPQPTNQNLVNFLLDRQARHDANMGANT